MSFFYLACRVFAGKEIMLELGGRGEREGEEKGEEGGEEMTFVFVVLIITCKREEENRKTTSRSRSTLLIDCSYPSPY